MPGPLNRRARSLAEAALNMGALVEGAPRQHFRTLAPRDGSADHR